MATFQWMGGLTWPKASVAEPLAMVDAVGGGRFVDLCRLRGTANRLLNQARIQMVAALLPDLAIAPASVLGEESSG